MIFFSFLRHQDPGDVLRQGSLEGNYQSVNQSIYLMNW